MNGHNVTSFQVSQLVAQIFQMRVRMKNLMGVMEGGSLPTMSNLEEAMKAEQQVLSVILLYSWFTELRQVLNEINYNFGIFVSLMSRLPLVQRGERKDLNRENNLRTRLQGLVLAVLEPRIRVAFSFEKYYRSFDTACNYNLKTQ